MNVELSVVVPTHNRVQHLERTLRALLAQTDARHEVIVVADDCGADTFEVVERCRRTTAAPVAIVTCSERSAARARNRGLATASGRFCCFLDTDIIVPAGFLATLVAVLGKTPTRVLLAPVYGNAASTATWPFLVDDHAAIESLAGDDLLHWASGQARLQDLRVAFADPETGSLDHLPAPWVFCWSSALVVARHLAERVGGFAEYLEVKGSEDIEFGLRLAKTGARFSMLSDSYVFHLPHERDRNLEELRDHSHERRLLMAHPTPEVEVLCAFDCVNANPMLDLLGAVHSTLGDLVKSAARHRADRHAYCLPAIDLIIGPPPVWSDPRDANARIAFPQALKATDQLNLFGFSLPFEDQTLRSVLITGIWQHLPERLAARIFGEALRIANEVYVLKDSHPTVQPVTVPQALLAAHDVPFWERSHPLKRSFYDFSLEALVQLGSLSSYRLRAL